MSEYQTAISCHNLSKRFDEGGLHVEVFTNLSLRVAKGERVAIIGASGSGKSTLLHLLGGLDKPSSGEVFIGEQDVNALSEQARCRLRNQQLGFIYQFHHLLPEFTVVENACMPLLIQGVDVRDARTRAEQLLIKVGLETRLKHKLNELSGGERQRVAIVRALVAKPACLLADEPTGNLDNKTAAQVFELMLELHQECQTSMVIVTHDNALAAKMQTTYELRDGQLSLVRSEVA